LFTASVKDRSLIATELAFLPKIKSDLFINRQNNAVFSELSL